MPYTPPIRRHAAADQRLTNRVHHVVVMVRQSGEATVCSPGAPLAQRTHGKQHRTKGASANHLLTILIVHTAQCAQRAVCGRKNAQVPWITVPPFGLWRWLCAWRRRPCILLAAYVLNGAVVRVLLLWNEVRRYELEKHIHRATTLDRPSRLRMRVARAKRLDRTACVCRQLLPRAVRRLALTIAASYQPTSYRDRQHFNSLIAAQSSLRRRVAAKHAD